MDDAIEKATPLIRDGRLDMVGIDPKMDRLEIDIVFCFKYWTYLAKEVEKQLISRATLHTQGLFNQKDVGLPARAIHNDTIKEKITDLTGFSNWKVNQKAQMIWVQLPLEEKEKAEALCDAITAYGFAKGVTSGKSKQAMVVKCESVNFEKLLSIAQPRPLV